MNTGPDKLAQALDELRHQEKLLRLESTFHGRTDPSAELGGRFAASDEAKIVIVGRKGVPGEYPAAAPAHMTKITDELPLGYSVEWQEPVGTEAEIQRAADIAQARGMKSAASEGVTTDPASSSVDRSHSQPQQLKMKRRV